MEQIYNIDKTGIGLFDGFMSKAQCQYYIDYFQRSKDFGTGMIWNHPSGKSIADDSRVTIFPPETYKDGLTDIPSIEEIRLSAKATRSLITTIQEMIMPKYIKAMHGLADYKYSFESAKIQKTEPGGGYHAWHTEAMSHTCANRIFVVQIYLNDVDSGGETEFLSQGKRVQPKEGRIVIFPCSYTHQHRGNPPLEGDKYVLNMWGTYA